MLFSISEGFVDTSGFQRTVYNGSAYYYSGTVFVRGMKAGEESIIALAKEFETTGSIPFKKLFGSFNCVISQPQQEDALLFR